MIQSLFARNFKSLRENQLDLGRLTVIVGPNASGKSSILQSADLLCKIVRSKQSSDDPNTANGTNWLDNIVAERRRGVNERITLEGKTESGEWRCSSSYPGKPLDIPHLHYRGSDSSIWQPNPDRFEVLPSSILLRLETSRLVNPEIRSNDPSVMEPDGAGLHSALMNLTLSSPDSWRELQHDLRGIIPSIHQLRYTRAIANQPTAILFDTVGGDSLLASQVSEGTLLVLGLLAALYAPDRPNLILLDDLDRGLHPKAQKDLISLLRQLMDANPDLQIIATTHSPYLLDCLEPHEVRMTVLRDDGSTVCAPLTDHPEFEKWKDEMAPGEMWSLFGEKWLLQKEAV